jgi:N-acetylglutamate synthase-like GNAT family acetyltransferase
MQVREISSEELDYSAMLCVDPGLSRKMRTEMRAAMEMRKEWLKAMMGKGLRLSVALDKSEDFLVSRGRMNKKIKELIVHGNVPKGLIEYLPMELALEPVKGEKSLFIDCVWVLPPFWHDGVGTALLRSVVENAKSYGGISVLAYEGDKWFGYSFDYMPISFFKKSGFKEVARDGNRVLLHLDLGAGESPSLIYRKCKAIEKDDRTVMDIFYNSQCPWSGWMVDRIEQGMRKYDAVVNAINTDDKRVIEKHGLSRGVCINGVPVVNRMAPWKEVESIFKQITQH